MIPNVTVVLGHHLEIALNAHRTPVETPMETVFVIDNGLVMIVQYLVGYVIHYVKILVLDRLPVIVYHALNMRLGTSLVVVFAKCIGQMIIAHIM